MTTITTKYIIDLLAINKGNTELIGSAANPQIKYSSDVDVQEYITVKGEADDELLKMFQEKYKLAMQNENIYITDFKCGSKNSNPIRWTAKTIMQGYQLDDNNKQILFTNMLNMQSTIKMDIIAFIGNEFVEFSCNYYITHDIDGKLHHSYPTNTTKEHVIQTLKSDVYEYKKDGNYFKMLKRIVSLRNLKGENVDNLISFFNSDTGHLNHQLNALKTILEVVDNTFRKPNVKDVKRHLKLIKSRLDSQYRSLFHSALNDRLTISQFVTEVEYIIDRIEPDVNANTLTWLREQEK